MAWALVGPRAYYNPLKKESLVKLLMTTEQVCMYHDFIPCPANTTPYSQGTCHQGGSTPKPQLEALVSKWLTPYQFCNLFSITCRSRACPKLSNRSFHNEPRDAQRVKGGKWGHRPRCRVCEAQLPVIPSHLQLTLEGLPHWREVQQ